MAPSVSNVSTRLNVISDIDQSLVFKYTFSLLSLISLEKRRHFKRLLTLISELTSSQLFTFLEHNVILLLQQKFLTELGRISGRLTRAIVNFPQFRNYPIIDSRFEGINEILAISFEMETGFTRWKS